MSIKLVTIDFWNTIFDSSNGANRNLCRQLALIEESDKLGAWLKIGDIEEAINKSWEVFNKIWMEEQRTPSPHESVKWFWDYFGLPSNKESIDRITKIFSESVLTHPPKLNIGVIDALESLSQKYQLAIISDTGFSPGLILRQLLKEYGIFNYFSAFSFSDETCVAKPHKLAFTKIYDELGVQPNESIHIGDIEATDIKGAKSIGARAIKYTGDPTGMFSNDRLKESSADAISESWHKIPEIIQFWSKLDIY